MATRNVIELWREKLDYLQQQEAVAADPALKFQLRKQVQEAEAQIDELSNGKRMTGQTNRFDWPSIEPPVVKFAWERFWCKRGSTPFLDRYGFLAEPAEKSRFFGHDVFRFHQIAETPCLILLGEPGMGKSTAVRQGAAESQQLWPNHLHRWRNLNQYQSDLQLIRDVFEHDEMRQWLKSDRILDLYLDGLDECLLRIDAVANIISEQLSRLPLHRLRLRITCRNAQWPAFLEDNLRRSWEDDLVGVYVLAPLTRADVIAAAATDSFMDDIVRRQAGPLASRPITLNFLINTARKGRVPNNRIELYREGCLRLCTEVSKSRRAARLVPRLLPNERMLIAARIAALMIYCRRNAVLLAPDLGDATDTDLTLSQLLGALEVVEQKTIEVNEIALLETLDTALFVPRGPERFAFSHQTYAEYLAAFYLDRHEASLPQIFDLISHAEGPRRIIPQLGETAAWLADMKPELLDDIIHSDPQVLLRSDVVARKKLLDALLARIEADELDHTYLQPDYWNLNHPKIAGQLRPVITDPSKGDSVRCFAIDIAGQCPDARTLQSELADIAVDKDEPFSVRQQSARATAQIGDQSAKLRLKSVLSEEDDDLRGTAITALWPTLISSDELFRLIKPPKRENFLGSYRFFIEHDLPESLKRSDLPAALSWVERQGPDRRPPRSFEELINAIMVLGWNNLDDPDVFDLFCRAALARLIGYLDPFHLKDLVWQDETRRRRLVAGILKHISGPEEIYALFRLVLPNHDLAWICDELQSEISEASKRKWARLADYAMRQPTSGQLEVVIAVAQSEPVLYEEIQGRLAAVALESPEARVAREQYAKHLKYEQEDVEPPLVEPPPSERIESCLKEFESGDLDAWWRLNMEMTLEPRSTHYADEFESDLTKLPGWKYASTMTRKRMLVAAESYVRRRSPEPIEWLGKNTLFRPDVAGYRALILIATQKPDELASLEPQLWKKWAPVILGCPTDGDANDEGRINNRMVSRAYEDAPDEIIDALLVLIDRENNRQSDWLPILERVTDCWDNRLAQALLKKAKDQTLRPSCVGDLLAELLKHGTDGACCYAKELAEQRLPPDETGKSRSREAAMALLISGHENGWQIVLPLILQDAEFGKGVLEDVAYKLYGRGSSKLIQRLRPSDAAELFLWLAREYPHVQDPDSNGFVSPRRSIARFRDEILEHLRAIGTQDAVQALETIVEALPNEPWLKWHLLRARQTALETSWIPPDPADVMKLLNSFDRRLVESGRQLLDVLEESLEHLNVRLQGETPAAIDLWNEIRPGVFRPKDEAALTDYINRHLDTDLVKRGVVVNREVVIRRGMGSSPGERVDIHVDAASNRSPNSDLCRIKAVIEVKGQWHPELKSAMETQLFERYLKDAAGHGLYVVGWFQCPAWDAKDHRHSATADLDEIQHQLRRQARSLSRQGAEIRVFFLNASLR